MSGITFSKLNSTTPAGTRVRRLFDGLEGALVRIDGQHAYVDLERTADDVWAGTLAAWELVQPRPMAEASKQATVATVGAGRSTHLAYYLASGTLRGTYCDRAASDRKRVRPHHTMTAEQVTCQRCLKVAAAETSVPAQEAERRAQAHPSAYLIHSTSTCHAMAPEDQVVDPSQVLPTCGDCLDEVSHQHTTTLKLPLKHAHDWLMRFDGHDDSPARAVTVTARTITLELAPEALADLISDTLYYAEEMDPTSTGDIDYRPAARRCLAALERQVTWQRRSFTITDVQVKA